MAKKNPVAANVETTVAAASSENKEVIQAVVQTPAAVVEAAPAVVQSVAAVSKASVANGIFKRMFSMEQRPARKDMIQAAMKEAGLTEKGAATYLQNYKSKNGLVAKKETTAAA